LIINILLLLVPFSVWGALFNQGFVVPAGLAKIYVVISLIGGILNVIFNYVFISLFGFVGVFWVTVSIASISTVVATVYFYIKVDTFTKSSFFPPQVDLEDSGGQRA
jgi:Na+-driven multidrug efflux pump